MENEEQKSPPVPDNRIYPISLPSSAEDKLNEYIEKRKLEIPIYDPQTGEPNLDYEKLTGKKNPMLVPDQINMLNNTPIIHEPKRVNRFLVYFPESFGLAPWIINSTNRPSMSIIPKKFLGITYKKTVKWDSIQVQLLDPIGPSSTKRIMNLIEKSILTPFTYTLEMIDPTGVVVERWNIKDCLISSVYFGELVYKNDDLLTITLIIEPNDIELDKKINNLTK